MLKDAWMKKCRAWIVVAGVAVLACAAVADGGFPNRISAGDVTAHSAVLWARVLRAQQFEVRWSRQEDFSQVDGSVQLGEANPDQPAKLTIGPLLPGTTYYYKFIADQAEMVGKFRTAHSDGRHGLRFGASGDWRGELAPYPAVRNAVGRKLDFFIELGDTIYADIMSPGLPGKDQAITLDDYRKKHIEVYGDRAGRNYLGDLRKSTAIFATIDDHEVTNDFAGGAHPSSDPRFDQNGNFINETDLYKNGLRAFHEYNPIESLIYGATGDPRTAEKTKLYRYRRFGQDAAMMMLDARSFRDVELRPANPLDQNDVVRFLIESFNPQRTMLAAAQLSDLFADLLDAKARGILWKFIVVPEPIQNLGVVGAADRFEGYAAERSLILNFVKQNDIKNVVFVAADIHGTVVNNLTYQTGPFQPQIPTDSFEISVGSVAFDAPLGPTVIDIASALGLISQQQRAFYDSLDRNGKDEFFKTLVDGFIAPLGYDTIGLQGSTINAELLKGGYVCAHTFGWTEFDINGDTGALTISTYGIAPYGFAKPWTHIGFWRDREPELISQFKVQPK